MDRGTRKRAAFVRLAEKRTLAVMEKLRILSNLANHHIYEYSDDDVREIFTAIEEEVQVARNRFDATQRRRPDFKLRGARIDPPGTGPAVPPNSQPEG